MRGRCGPTVRRLPAKTAVLPAVWACGLGRTLLGVEIRNAYWRQFHAMRAQAFNRATVFPGEPTAKPLHIWTARSSQGDFCLRIFRRWGPSGSRSPCYRGGSSNGWLRRRWQLQKDFHVGGLQPGDLVPHLILSGGKLLNGLLQQRQTLRHLLHLLRVEGGATVGTTVSGAVCMAGAGMFSTTGG